MKKILCVILLLQISCIINAGYYKQKKLYINGITPKLKWQKAESGKLPDKAYAALKGLNGPVYICQAQVSDGIAAGELRDGACMVADGSKIMKAQDYQILVSHDKVTWLSMRDMYQYYSRKSLGYLPQASLPLQNIDTENKFIPIIGGYTFLSRNHPEVNYICRGMHDVDIAIGSVTRNKCQIISGDRVVETDMFQILAVQSE